MRWGIIVFLFWPQIFSHVFAQEFLFGPYTVIHSDNSYSLRFQLRKVKELSIEVVDEQRERPSLRQGRFAAGKMHSLELGKIGCEQQVRIHIKEREKGDQLFEKSYKGPPCEEDQTLDILLIGDTQRGSERHLRLAQAIGNNPEFDSQMIVHAGDIVQSGESLEEWIDFFQVGRSYLSSNPIIAAVGNHEYRDERDQVVPNHFKYFMRWPGHRPNGGEKWVFPQVDFIALNSNFKEMTKQQRLEQMRWFEEELEWSKLNGKKVVVVFHHPPFASSMGVFSKGCRVIRKKFVPILEKAGNVVLVLAGHTHIYERSFKAGIHYVTTGPAGGKKFPPSWHNRYGVFIDRSLSETYSLIGLSKKELHLRTFNQDNKLIDELKFEFRQGPIPFAYEITQRKAIEIKETEKN